MNNEILSINTLRDLKLQELESQESEFRKKIYEVNRDRTLKIARAIVDLEDILKTVKKKYKNDNKLIEKLEFLLQILKGEVN